MIDVFLLANIVGSAAFALSGFFVGVRKELDYMGIFIVSLMTAGGGGVLRDVLVGRVPLLLSDFSSFVIVMSVIIAAIGFKLYRHENLSIRPWFIMSDSIGLVAFSVTGALVGIDAGLPVYGGMVLAFLTATGGGIIRDILVNDMPSLLTSDFYGTIAILVAGAIYIMHGLGWQNDWTIGGIFMAALLLRWVAYKKQWQLPRVDRNNI